MKELLKMLSRNIITQIEEDNQLFNTYNYTITISLSCNMWVPVSSIGKVSDCCIRNLGFNPHLYQKTDWKKV